ncbi:MAG: CobW family GTP-binding protein [Pseudomonadota bacterium]|nr:CobW family GTP-binding protein [Pseudomonadota bacterium]
MPVLVVSGFLGSGKTTLVRHLLEDAQARGERVAIVSNEFGALGIDEALLGGGEERFVELAGGCVCCQLSDELVDTLEALRLKVDPDRIVIETSGVALPFETQLNLYRPPVNAWVGDEASVVVVSAAQLHEGEELDGTFLDQVSSADLLLLHKIDLVPAHLHAALEARLVAMNPDAPVLRAAFGQVDPALLFPVGPGAAAAPARSSRASRLDPQHDHPHDHEHDHERFVAEELRVPDGLPEAEAYAWIDARRGLRTKGFVRTREGLRIVQGVGRRLELVPPGDLPVPPQLVGRVVVIRRESSHARHTS